MSKVSWAGSWLPVLHRLPSGQYGSKTVALTIDDGPTDTTPHMLSVLARAHAKATFFLSGERLAKRLSMLPAILADGHAVYAHGVEHVPLDRHGANRLRRDLESSEAVLARYRPTPRPYLVRLPYAAGRRKAWVHRAIRSWSPDAQIAHWSLSAEDHTIAPQCETPSDVDRLCRQAVDGILNDPHLDGSIILAHDEPFDVPSFLVPDVAARLIELLVDGLTARGYAIAPLRPDPSPTFLSRFLLHK